MTEIQHTCAGFCWWWCCYVCNNYAKNRSFSPLGASSVAGRGVEASGVSGCVVLLSSLRACPLVVVPCVGGGGSVCGRWRPPLCSTPQVAEIVRPLVEVWPWHFPALGQMGGRVCGGGSATPHKTPAPSSVEGSGRGVWKKAGAGVRPHRWRRATRAVLVPNRAKAVPTRAKAVPTRAKAVPTRAGGNREAVARWWPHRGGRGGFLCS